MSEYSILRGITRAVIRHEPYAHIVVEGCLPASLYTELARRRAKPNSRHDVGARCILQNPDCLSRHWLEFVRYHVSNSFYREFIELMGQEIMAAYPELERRLGRPLCELRTGILDTPEAADCDVALDCHIGINTPSRRCGSVRRVHTDAPDELFAALICFRAENDGAEGGDLEILRWKRNNARLFVGSEVAESDAEPGYTMVTNPNTAVIFINSASALHAVSARGASLLSRRLVNIMGRMPRSIPEGLFEKRQKRDLWSLGRRALQRYRSASGRF